MGTIINSLKKVFGLTAAASLAAIAIPATSMAVPEDAAFQERGDFQIAQERSCREVDADSGLNVRAEPWGPVIGRLENNQNVFLENPATAGGNWVEIQSPMQGVVAAKFLSYCTAATPQPEPEPIAMNGCREVSARGGLNVRSQPEIDSPVVTQLPNNAQVEIASQGIDGWVPLQNYNGYVAAQYLTMCN